MRKVLILAMIALLVMGCLASRIFADEKTNSGKKKFFFTDEKQTPGVSSQQKKNDKEKKTDSGKKVTGNKKEVVVKSVQPEKAKAKTAVKTDVKKPAAVAAKPVSKTVVKKSSAAMKPPVVSGSTKAPAVVANKTVETKAAKASVAPGKPAASAGSKGSPAVIDKAATKPAEKAAVKNAEPSKKSDKTEVSDEFNLNPETASGDSGAKVESSPSADGSAGKSSDVAVPSPSEGGADDNSAPSPDKGAPDLKDKGLPIPGEDETAKITAVEVKGNKHISTEDILKVIRSKIGDPLLEPRIRSDVQAVYEMGYFTDVKVDTPYYNGGKKLVFRVQENPLIQKITLIGNKIVPTSKLLELIQTKEGQILNMKTLNTDMMEINYYYDESLGYQLKPTHIKDVNYTTDGELMLTIQEGMIINQVEVKGSSLFPEDQLLSMVTVKKGELLNTKEVSESCNNIAKFYDEEGYILNPPRPQVDYKGQIVTIQLVEAVVEDIKVEITPVKGRDKAKTKPHVVLRNIRTQKGEILQKKKLKRDIERLNNLGYFSRVDMDPEPGSKPGDLVLVFKVQEQKTGLATIGLGYSGGGSGALRSGITGALSYSEKNMGGTGQGVAASWQRGVNIDSLMGSYSNPAINKNQDSISLTLFRHNYMELKQPLNNDVSTNKYSLYDDKRQGGSLVYGRRITDDFRFFFSLRHENVKITRNKNSDYEPIGLSEGALNAGGIGGLYDTRNDIFDPTEGFYGDAAATLAGGMFGGKYDYQKYQVELRKYFPIGKKKKSTIALRAWGGILKGNENDIPVTETFYVGGTDTIRGYNQNEFYGTRMVVLNAEYRFPIANIKFLKGAIFADAGNAWFPYDDRKKLYTDAGAGLRIVFPTLSLGVIRLDYAASEKGGRTSIGIGQTF